MSKNTDSRCRDNDICLKIRTPKAETMIYSMFKNKDSRCRDNDTVYVLKNGHLNLRRDNDTIMFKNTDSRCRDNDMYKNKDSTIHMQIADQALR